VTTQLQELHPVIQHHLVNSLGWGSLRPLQRDAIAPVMAGEDALLLAPTAGGKTEAAALPLLSRMAAEGWQGLSVLYVCPLRALLNNLEPRLGAYAAWLGRRVGLWHGDTPADRRKRMVQDPPDVLLTTPESLESMLVSTGVDHRRMFADVRAVVVDEVHAFAGDDRGWHLLAVLERLTQVTRRPIQRVGLSATVGNAEDLLAWLQGSGQGVRPASVVAPAAEGTAVVPDLQLDYVGTVPNAAKVVSALHSGEKRLVFADSRRTVEKLAAELHERGTQTFMSHSSLSLDERRRAEAAFAEARDCVIVSTSTLELGIDVGDLDRVVQVGAPTTVASFLQRLGRTGRRPGVSRSMLFLETTDEELLRAAGLLLLWSEGFVEPVVPPPSPRHLAAQQLLATCLQEGRVGRSTWPEWTGGLGLASPEELAVITDDLVDRGHLDTDADMLFIGPETERRYGHRHFLELLSAFTADPQFVVLHGRVDIGAVDPMVLTRKVTGPRLISLGGRPWEVTYIDWKRRRAYVEPSPVKAASMWPGAARPLSFALTDAMRRVLLGADPPGVELTRRAVERLAVVREEYRTTVDDRCTVLGVWRNGQHRWWTWAGARANAALHAALKAVDPTLVDGSVQFDDRFIRLRGDATAGGIKQALVDASEALGHDLQSLIMPTTAEAVRQLKFSDLLPEGMAQATLASRHADTLGAGLCAARPIVTRST
jgi:ATP-dependent Lhr-like helicase